MKNFQHFLLTNYNIYYIQNKTKTNQLVSPELRLNREYLGYRLNLFKKYTLSSVINQTSKDFIWFILFDINTPKIIKDELNELFKEFDFIRAFYIDKNEALNYRDFFNQKMMEFSNKSLNYIISTRIDNDDAINEIFIETIQKKVATQKKISGKFMVFPRGLIYLHEKGYFYNVINEGSHFNTYISDIKKDKLKNAFEFNHSFVELRLNNIILDFDKTPMWVEVRHNYNFMNGLVDKKHTSNNKQKILSMLNVELTDIELESLLIEDRYRFFHLLKNILVKTRFTYFIYKIMRKFKILISR